MSTTSISLAADNKTARRLLSFIEEFRKLNPNIQAGQIAVFLHIMAKPGITMKELEKATNLSSTAVSRNVLALSEWFKVGEPGYDLVETYDDPQDRRNKRVRPKPKGMRVYNTLIQLLGS
ncbi:MarR family transcriptional regulator [Sinorhizobium meliloti]|uniref:MarR family winged helix-turn-helix transcriptional regulator n=1 Tax=Rhizobium meliloti TaxID=382 RepID=UPI000FDC4885|nr:MarR family winged helix-turn-helix transcriptional regulator [Sinorhizobium meliloti]MDX1046924.1 MarR family transcriptional regulator [Sinorhizobium medicae]MDW9519150.1 MarR family transcriptional regulator [Sinorhizobium meliloti]MDX0094229.1 MarR family transcriptional regulator [Sinorhizobium meliloti]MDX0139247.1 MarR family transcriptional regulator [Sinorhizobium meliloti]MDX0194077.1 MarR family transcriptional regulator [Sinorhizobium meliloti]